MESMKVTMSLPDSVFRAADSLARRLRKSRSELCAEAIAAYIDERGAGKLTAKLNVVYGKESSSVDTALNYAQFRCL